MGMLKGFKDIKNMMAATPGLLEQTSQLSANAQAMSAQAAAAAGTAPGAAPGAATGAATGHHGLVAASAGSPLPDELSAAIAGVDLATYAKVSAGLAQFGYDTSRIGEVAAQHGIDLISWQTAMDGWNARITASPAVASQFNAFYTGRA